MGRTTHGETPVKKLNSCLSEWRVSHCESTTQQWQRTTQINERMNYFRPKPQDKKRESGPQALYVDGTSENVSRHKTCSQRQIQMHIDSALRAKAVGGTPYPSVPSLGSYTCFGGMGVTLIRELALSPSSSIAYAPPPPNKGRCCCAALGGGAGAVAAAVGDHP